MSVTYCSPDVIHRFIIIFLKLHKCYTSILLARFVRLRTLSLFIYSHKILVPNSSNSVH
uniref:Uncharacterized protein n=1 Tax=Octopus bimaculoides TaxID=37653 RepID=A0A0L8HTA4_OCTBM